MDIAPVESPYKFTEQDFSRLRDQVHRHTGIYLSDKKRELVYGRISRRLRELELESFSAYADLIDHGHEEELEHFANAISTNLTAFCRESHHFTYLADQLIPELLARRKGKRRIRIWSAGCSSGEEAYNIAMVLRENIPDLDRWDARILATDIDSAVLKVAEDGIYPADRLASLPVGWRERWFLKGKGQHAGLARAKKELRDLLTIRQLNLMHQWPMKGPFDVVFCRNVAIYFDKPTQTRLFDRVADILTPDGHLFVGHSESLQQVSNRYELIGKTTYRNLARARQHVG